MKKIIVLALVLFCFGAAAQTPVFDTSRNLRLVDGDGFTWKAGRFRNFLRAPHGLPEMARRDSGSLAWYNNMFWQYDNTGVWDTLSGTGGGGFVVTLDSIYAAGLIDTSLTMNPGYVTIFVKPEHLDSLRHRYIDTGSTMRNGYTLVFDSTNRKWIMGAVGSGNTDSTLQQVFNKSVAAGDVPKINVGTDVLDITGTGIGTPVLTTSTNAVSGIGIIANSNKAIGIIGQTQASGTDGSSAGVYGRGDIGGSIGVLGVSSDFHSDFPSIDAVGIPGVFTNTVVGSADRIYPGIELRSITTPSFASNGLGSSLSFRVSTSSFTNELDTFTNRITSRWTTADLSTRSSQMDIWGVNNTTESIRLSLLPSGQLSLPPYGSGTFTGTPAFALNVDASGNIIEGTVGGGGSSTQALNQTLLNGNITKQKIIWVDSVATAGGSGLPFTEYYPQNYNTAYPGYGTQASFSQGYGYYPGVNPTSGRPNVVGLLWGYNGGFNTALIAGEPTWGARTEIFYEMGGGIGHSEFHGISPEFKSIDGVSRRLGSYYVNNTTGVTQFTQQIDALTVLHGATDTAMFTLDGNNTVIGLFSNGHLTVINQRLPNNYFDILLGNTGPVFGLGNGTTAAATSFQFNAPVLGSTHATIGTNLNSAFKAKVGTAGYSGLNVEQVGLTSSSFKGLYADVNTTATFDLINARNLGTAGTLQTLLQASGSGGGTAQYILQDSDGWSWYMKYKGGTIERTLYFNFGADSLLKIRGDNGNILAKYSLSIGTANPTARLMLPASTTAASTGALKFTNGTAPTTPEIGLLNFQNGFLLLDSSNAVRDTLATRSWARNNISGGGGGGGDLLANGTVPLTANWNLGAFKITSTKTGATAATVYDAFIATNTTTASAGNQMYGGAIHSIGQGWKTDATAASQSVDNRWYTVPVQGTAAPTGNFVMEQSIAGGAYNTVMKMTPTVFGTSGNGTFELFNTFRLSVLNGVGTRYGNIGGGGGYVHQFMDNNFATTLAQVANTAAGGNYFNNVTNVGSSAVATSTLKVTGSFAPTYIAKTVDYTATISDCYIDLTVTAKTITLPTAVGITGRIYNIKLTVSGTGTVATTSSQTIDGSTTYSLSAQYKYVEVQSNGANWNIVANN